GVGDEEPILDGDGSGSSDEVAEDVAVSDASAVDEVIREADESIRLDSPSLVDERITCISIAKLHGLANEIVHSPTLRGKFKAGCHQAKIEEKLMLRNVSTR
ncbi:hypothetical protein BDN70DRAFT_940066, partial [Pholiota conissans]